MTAQGWTIAEAVAEFERAGLPVDPARFRMAIRAFRIRPVGERRAQPGSKGGRGQVFYEIGHLQLLHSEFMQWRDRLG